MPAGRKDPFMSFVRPFKPIEHFLLDYYVTVVVPFLRCQEDISIYQDSMTKRWVPFALREGGLLDAVFLLACRHMYLSHHNSQQQQQFVQLACQYKLSCTKSLRDAISNEVVFSDATVGTTLMLAYDELVASDISMYKNHIKAAVRMVNLNGGPQTLGLDGFMEHLISNLCAKHKLYDQT
ncbi:hypothetical protein A1O3_00970 [Capronia epimyces CBS 606.96]|uniref:Transcription factor domain-containing protein n=1 Tax=Capronia epimyces CBS 606.96 TaxID=1182542 RepID=W9ZD41_9EURO|nr:uncharacterized protein A1O3_00970 [Capronia epimyces CBS 606.96]EXJ92419.1 hypothetical protein A1O3_00970 [Capronia epimyces CBS 606.96]